MRFRAGIVVVVALAAVAVPSAAAFAAWECNSGKMCGYDGTGGTNRLYQISGPAGTKITLSDADRDKTTSGRNRTSNYYCGVNVTGLWDETVYEFAPGSQVNLGSAANNKIDHYDVKAHQGNCYNPIF